MNGLIRWSVARLKTRWTRLTLAGALLLALAVPSPHAGRQPRELFSVVGSDFISPLISSPHGIQMLNSQLNDYARFVGFDQIRTFVATGSTRQLVHVSRYSGDLFALFGAEFILRSTPGTQEHPIAISEEFWKRVLGQTPDVLGRTLEACGETFEIAAVVRVDSAVLGETEVWMPLSSRGSYGNMTALRVIGELAPLAEWGAGERKLSDFAKKDFVREQIVEVGTLHLLPIDRKMLICREDDVHRMLEQATTDLESSPVIIVDQ